MCKLVSAFWPLLPDPLPTRQEGRTVGGDGRSRSHGLAMSDVANKVIVLI